MTSALSNRRFLLLSSILVVLAFPLGRMARSLAVTHRVVATYTALIAAANAQDLEAVRRRCTARYLRTHPLAPAPEGGVVGLPRNIHKNFQVWREGPDVWLCPTNR